MEYPCYVCQFPHPADKPGTTHCALKQLALAQAALGYEMRRGGLLLLGRAAAAMAQALRRRGR